MLIGFNFFEYLIIILLMIPSTILGSKTGQVLLFKMNEKTFKIIFDIVLFIVVAGTRVPLRLVSLFFQYTPPLK